MDMQNTKIDILRQANDLLLKGEPEEARKLLDTINKTSDMNGTVAFFCGNTYLQEKAYSKAHACYVEALKDGLAHEQLFLNLGAAKEQLNDPVGAEAMYRQAAELNPSKADALNRIISLRLSLGNVEGAEQVMDELMSRNPELLDGFHHKAGVLLGTDRAKEALKLLYGVAERFSSQPLYVYDLCRALARLGHSQDALEFLLTKEDVFSNVFYRQLFIKQKASLLTDLGQADDVQPLWNELFSNYADRQAGFALIAAALRHEDMEGVLRLTDEILADGAKDRIYYLCLYVKVLALKAQKSEMEEDALQKAAVEFEALDPNGIGPSLRMLRAIVLAMAGKKEHAAADFESVESLLRAAEDVDGKDDILARFSSLRDDVL